MDSKELMQGATERLENLSEPIPNTLELLKPFESEDQKAERLLRLKDAVQLRLQVWGIPSKFIRPDFKSSIQWTNRNRGLCLTGKAGVGKTMALCLIVRDWLLERTSNVQGYFMPDHILKAWKFVVFPEFVMRVQDSFKGKKGDETAWEMLEALAKTPYLILDDLGAEKPTDYVRQATYYIINHREMNELPTFITTNFSMDHLDENIDPRISSRIAGMCEIIRMEGKDRRFHA